MSEELQQKLRSQLWTVANTLRGNMSASDFMYFTLGFIFYKYLSEKIELYANEILEEDHITFKEVWNGKDEELKQDVKEECIQNLGYFIEPEYLYSTIIELISKKENILPSLERSLKKIEDSTIGQDSEDDFGGLFSDLDLASPKLGKTADDKNKLISDVLIALNGIDFGLQEAGDIDILGDAYEYMISQFAAGAGKKAGEFYTPQEVSQILAEIVITGKVRLKDVFDPTCGSGSLLLRTAKSGKADSIFGQEKNPTTFNLCRMNMLLHGVKYNDFDIQNGDTLEADAFGDRQFDAAPSNPGLKATWYEFKGNKCSEIEKAPVNGTYPVEDVMIPKKVKGNIGLIIKGYFNAPQDDIYTFALLSDDGSTLTIDSEQIVDNDGPHGPKEIVGQKALAKGYHPMELRYFDQNGGQLKLKVTGSDGKEIPFTHLYAH